MRLEPTKRVYQKAQRVYSNVASDRMQNYFAKPGKTDTTSLNIAWRAAHQMNKINALFGDSYTDVVLEAQALQELGRTGEAKTFLQGILKTEQDKEIRKVVMTELRKLD